MKIDTSKIPNFEALPEEAKAAILDMELPDMSQFVAKAVFDKKASEAAELGKQLKSKMSQDEQVAAQQAETLKAMQEELEQLRMEKTVSEYTKRYMGVGYDEALATETAQALAKGDMDAMFKNHAKFMADREKALKTELLKKTPEPTHGIGDKGFSKADFQKLSLMEKQKFATENPEQYKAFYQTGGDN